ncbi:ATP-dependent nuclease [Achromobacter insolitus]|uniref:ATP-dependent nuclease n=1 Tax=Achromobacter insolitus TaxID=217204 RepID=UPI000B1E299F|nr:ATP-binding protein [Achromobacter insolitus]AVG41538.1 DNA helicase [Achromobacter insolitus]
MYIKHLVIKRFRGIESLKWSPGKGVNCLVGPGDSCKTTILDAIDFLFAERHNIAFDDLDFYKADTTQQIRIVAVLADLPRDFLREDRYGLSLSGWQGGDNPWVEEPNESAGIEAVLCIELQVDSTLEPDWHVLTRRRGVSDRTKKIAFEDRKVLAPARLGGYANRHLSWGRGSALQRVGASPEELPATLSRLVRAARDSFTENGANAFNERLGIIGAEIAKLGVRFESGLVANLDYGSISMGAGGVALHDGDVPVRRMGTGSSRLAVAALQSADSGSRQFFLVDEVEYGLEPHRISVLTSHLRNKVAESGQVFMTTHSPFVLRELRFNEVVICRRDSADGTVRVRGAGRKSPETNEERRYTRNQGEALLSKRILVCEGQTEVGLMKGWASKLPVDFQTLGVTVLEGNGDPEAFGVALHYAALGYKVALLMDSDKDISPKDAAALKAAGVPHYSWERGRCTEVELFLGIPVELRKRLLATVLSDEGYSVMAACGQIGSATSAKYAALADLLPLLESDETADVIGKQANGHKWVKHHYDLAYRVGQTIIPLAMSQGVGTLAAKLREVHLWLSSDA